MAGFDFAIDETGELVIDSNTYELKKKTDDELRIQLAYTRIKSISNNWFYDNVGANLEELVGRSIRAGVLDVGVQKITEVLTYYDLWDVNDIYIQTTIKDSTHVIYSVYLRLDTNDEFGEKSIEMNIELDLIKGVRIKYGWK